MEFLLEGFQALKWQQVVMWAIGLIIIAVKITSYAIAKSAEIKKKKEEENNSENNPPQA